MTERPSTIQERKDLVIINTEIERKKEADSYHPMEVFSSDNFPNILPNIYIPNQKLLAQPFGARFPCYLAYRLRVWPYKEVADHLNACFPRCDNVDCEYLEEVVEELRLQEKWAKDRPMFVNTPGSEALFIANAAKVDKWIKKQRLRLTKAEHVRENPIEATLPFKGPVSSLAEILYEMERKGHISLKEYRNQKGNMDALCRTLCRIFPPITSSSKNPALALKLELAKIPIDKLGEGELDAGVLRGMGKKKGTKEFRNEKGLGII